MVCCLQKLSDSAISFFLRHVRLDSRHEGKHCCQMLSQHAVGWTSRCWQQDGDHCCNGQPDADCILWVCIKVCVRVCARVLINTTCIKQSILHHNWVSYHKLHTISCLHSPGSLWSAFSLRSSFSAAFSVENKKNARVTITEENSLPFLPTQCRTPAAASLRV